MKLTYFKHENAWILSGGDLANISHPVVEEIGKRTTDMLKDIFGEKTKLKVFAGEIEFDDGAYRAEVAQGKMKLHNQSSKTKSNKSLFERVREGVALNKYLVKMDDSLQLLIMFRGDNVLEDPEIWYKGEKMHGANAVVTLDPNTRPTQAKPSRRLTLQMDLESD
ncbi:hypothetical protein N6G95_09515 [Pediococcus inopinatus]|uniref:hypothetical protein n=1 Tax=Pediococcus inopinatus TaxID=114090 RepID=UPI002B2607CA|nr:hypothetical protein [Pediococcus inopinatus]WPC19441.1 hypothetical protein N6G95_09515 [Pediococcus inopinatus]